jgi:hypothetical protein
LTQGFDRHTELATIRSDDCRLALIRKPTNDERIGLTSNPACSPVDNMLLKWLVPIEGSGLVRVKRKRKKRKENRITPKWGSQYVHTHLHTASRRYIDFDFHFDFQDSRRSDSSVLRWSCRMHAEPTIALYKEHLKLSIGLREYPDSLTHFRNDDTTVKSDKIRK